MPGEYRSRDGNTYGPNWEDLADSQKYTLSVFYGGETFSFTSGMFTNFASNHYIFIDEYNYPRRKDNNEVWDTGVNTSAVFILPNLTKLIASTKFYYSDKNIPTSGFSGIYGKQNDLTTLQSFMLEAPRAFHDDLSTEASFSWNFGRMDYESPSKDLSRHDQHSINALNRWSWYPGNKLTLRSGIDYKFILMESTGTGSRSRHDGGIYLAAEMKPVRQFLIIPSVKAVTTTSNKIVAVPKLGLLWNVNDFFALRNNYFRSFKFPDFEELYWTGGGGIGNPDLRPEDGWGGDFGAVFSLNNFLKLESVFFTQWLKDSIHWYPGPGGIWQPENVGEAIFFGLDSKVDFEIPVSFGPIKKILPSFSYKYLRSYLLSFGYTYDSNKRIPYTPEHTLGASVEFPWSGGSFSVSGHYESLRYSDRSNLSELKPYFLLNTAINQKIGKYFSASAVLRNILNQLYETYISYPLPGISLTLGIRAEFGINQ